LKSFAVSEGSVRRSDFGMTGILFSQEDIRILRVTERSKNALYFNV
jgi:hypothetical protein